MLKIEEDILGSMSRAFRIASAHARRGDRDSALYWLGRCIVIKSVGRKRLVHAMFSREACFQASGIEERAVELYDKLRKENPFRTNQKDAPPYRDLEALALDE